MRLKFILVLLSLLLLGISSCTFTPRGHITYDLLVYPQKGMSKIELQNALDHEEEPRNIINNIELKATSDDIDVLAYILHNGAGYEAIYFTFKNDDLFYWGKTYEYIRENDPLIEELGYYFSYHYEDIIRG